MAKMAELAGEKPEQWGGRPGGGDDPLAAGTAGASRVTNGAWPIVRVVLIFSALLALVAVVNVMTLLDDAHRRGETLAPIIPIALEGTSALGALLALPVVLAALGWAPPGGRRPLAVFVAAHFAGSLAFSALHVGMMELMRAAIAWAAGHPRHWTLAEWPYEYRKDAVSYLVIAGAFWFLGPGTRRAGGSKPASTPGATPPATFDIRDGGAVIRAPVAEILAAQAAGNYVEFLLVDGRRPLMRGSLREIETALAAAGFLRTHRSWLVNAAAVRALVPAGSGDYRLDLGAGVGAPLSRRYPAALAQLRPGR